MRCTDKRFLLASQQRTRTHIYSTKEKILTSREPAQQHVDKHAHDSPQCNTRRTDLNCGAPFMTRVGSPRGAAAACTLHTAGKWSVVVLKTIFGGTALRVKERRREAGEEDQQGCTVSAPSFTAAFLILRRLLPPSLPSS